MEVVPDQINFPKMEEKVLEFWAKIDAFQTQLKQSKNKPRYTFYDGPPFATGLPHYGHILAGTIKDIVTRWAHGSGFHVDRRFGWDCHGLPVEYEIDKQLNIKGPEDVEKMGIKAYNDACRQIVMRYSSEWEELVTRFGRWIDFKRDYKTMYPWFMESVWWVFKTLWEKGLVYRGFKVMPFSTACSTPLSNFEAGQNYKDVVDPAVMVNFPLDSDPSVSLVAWTTTPWTLPSNLALCVHPEKSYVKIRDLERNCVYILMEARLPALYRTEEEYKVLDKFQGEKLRDLSYKPLFEYFSELKSSRGAFRVLVDRYVTEDSGTGVVHQAPYFGEDDYRISLAAGIISRDSELICPVDATGRFSSEVTHFSGLYVKDADPKIVKHMKENGRLVHASTIKHSYPFCWRSDTPLLYKAVPSWFIRVEQMVEMLLKNNQQTYWVPEFVRDKRFANWLAGARDWAVSRNRYWGNPMPIWVSEDGVETICVGSVEELEQLSGVKVNDLHREFVDDITIPSCRPGMPPLRRVPEVFDCWFESGSMPYAQQHYPFENKKDFEENFPADFIAEGVDQTRGWFYTLLVVSTALFGKPPFKNLIVNGLVLSKDGSKMSKRKKNYTDPRQVVDLFGADALRLYLINSPVVRADTLRFQDDGVKDVLKDVFLPWYNAYRFFVQNVLEVKQDGKEISFRMTSTVKPSNYMDCWILSFTQSLIKFVRAEMAAYRLYTVVPRLVKFVDQLTNWYVRMNRRRIKGDSGFEERKAALETLFEVLFSMIRVMAPFIPFLTEHMFQNLRHVLTDVSDESQDMRSVHFVMLPQPREDVIETHIERAVASMQNVIELGRALRDRNTLPTKYPLRELVVVLGDADQLADVQTLSEYILEELNVRALKCTSDKARYGVQLAAEPDYRALGARLRGKLATVKQGIGMLTQEQLEQLRANGSVEVAGETMQAAELKLKYVVPENKGNYQAHASGEVLVMLDVTPDESMVEEGVAREVVNRVQKLRRKLQLVPTDAITVYAEAEGSLQQLLSRHAQFVSGAIKQPLKTHAPLAQCQLIGSERAQVKGCALMLSISRGHDKTDTNLVTTSPASSSGPSCPWVDVYQRASDVNCRRGTVLLRNPVNAPPLNMAQLAQQVCLVFERDSVTLSRDQAGKQTLSLDSTQSALPLAGTTLYC